jgi:hypothetical protein
MDTNANPQLAAKDASAGAIAETETTGVTMLVCALLVATCFAAPIFLTLPETMGAAATPPQTISEVASASASTFHERHLAQPTVDWTDLDEGELATWRLRSSD